MPRGTRIPYEAEGTAMVGYLAHDDGFSSEPRPGVLLLHEVGGQDDNVRLALAGYHTLAAQRGVDDARLAAVGFCFGGAMALELACSAVPLRAAIGFHPGFIPGQLADCASITASVLMICGAEDPVVSTDDRQEFEREMRESGVRDWRLEVHGGVGHSFTNPEIADPGLDWRVRLRRACRPALVDIHAGTPRRGVPSRF